MKTKEVIKVSKKASSLVPETLDPFLKTLAAGLMNSLSERQDVQILLHPLVVFRWKIYDVVKGIVVSLSRHKVDQRIGTW